MKAIILEEPNGAESLVIKDIDTPTIEDQEILIEVKAISINPVDLKTSVGGGIFKMMDFSTPAILGWDISGIVVDSKSEDYKPGDEVFGMVNFPGKGNAYALYVAAPASHVALKPKNISHEEAAAATLAALTAYQAFTVQATIKPGQKVLVHAAAGGVGHYAVQIAKHLGAIVTGTSSAKNKNFVMECGADHHIDYHIQNWEDKAEEFDLVLDCVGNDNLKHSLVAVKKGGTIISIPSGVDHIADEAEAKNVQASFFLVQSSGSNMSVIASMLEKGILKSHIAQTFSFDEIKNAFKYLSTGRTVGKVIVLI